MFFYNVRKTQGFKKDSRHFKKPETFQKTRVFQKDSRLFQNPGSLKKTQTFQKDPRLFQNPEIFKTIKKGINHFFFTFYQ